MKLRILFKIGLIVFMIYIICQLMMKLLGHSWTIEEVILSIVILHLSWSVYMQRQFSEHIGEHKLIEYKLSMLELQQTNNKL